MTGRSMDWTLEDNMVDGLFFCATLTGGHNQSVQAEEETSDTAAEAIKPEPGSFWKGHFERVGGVVGSESAESCRVVRPLHIPLVIRPVRHMYVVVVRQTDELLCSRYKSLSRFEAPYICTRWTGERGVKHVSRHRGTAC